jgi:hypothetical protein
MLRYHMAVVTRDVALKRALKRLTTAMAATADFVMDGAGLVPGKGMDLAIIDARAQTPGKDLLSRIPADAKILYIIAEDSLTQRLLLFRDERVTSLFCYDERFDDEEFISSATKALRGEIFGLQKYFPWGVTSFSMKIQNHDEKERAIDIMMEFANLAGVRGGVRDRIQTVADELIMNALYHAPVDTHGEELYRNRPVKELAKLDRVNPVQVQYGCSGRYFGVSVRDACGTLTRFRLLDYLLRAGMTPQEIESKAGGAGLGLVTVVKSVSKLVFNIQPRTSTEVVCLFDMELFARGKMGTRSLHMFVVPERDAVEDDDDTGAPRRVSAFAGPRAVAVAALLAVASSLGTALYMQHASRDGGAAARCPDNCPPPRGAAGSGATGGGTGAPGAPGVAPAPPSSPSPDRPPPVRPTTRAAPAAKNGSGAAGAH